MVFQPRESLPPPLLLVPEVDAGAKLVLDRRRRRGDEVSVMSRL
jgi:hypothetical protein